MVIAGTTGPYMKKVPLNYSKHRTTHLPDLPKFAGPKIPTGHPSFSVRTSVELEKH